MQYTTPPRIICVTHRDLAKVGLKIAQHPTEPKNDEWYVNGTLGPFETPEVALLAGIRWLWKLYRDACEVR